jgi:GT2 family glycosyltransferase
MVKPEARRADISPMEPRPSPRVAVVVVNWNGGDVLTRCLDALAGQTLAPARIIVVDNASTDGSVDRLEERHRRVEVIRLAGNVGFAAGNNLAVHAADGCDWVALLNPDAFPEPGWLEALLRARADEPDFDFFASRLLQAEAPDTLDGAGDSLHANGLAFRRDHGAPAAGTALAREETFSACAAAALYRRDAFLQVGGFDERFFCYFEDTDLAFRLRLAGHRCLYVPDAVVHHVGSALAGAMSDFTVYHSYRNLAWTWAKNMPRGLAWRHAPEFALAHVLLLGAFLVRGRPGVVLRAQWDALRGLRWVRAERRRLQEERRATTDEIGEALTTGFDVYLTSFTRWGLRQHGRLAEAAE